jgi:hypothetical protein
VTNFPRFLDPDSFVNAIAPKDDLTKLGRSQFAILFRVADTSKRGLLSWEDFLVFETVLKRPDADYWMAFQYFDVYVIVRVRLWISIHAVASATTRVTSPTMSSRTSSAQASVRMRYLSTLNGASREVVVLREKYTTKFLISDWVKLYLGKKNGTHVLGCALQHISVYLL